MTTTSTGADAAPHTAAIIDRPDVWAGVVGQHHAVTQLRAAAANPVHAYLLQGPFGSGKKALAVAFAAALLGIDAAERDADVDRAVRLTLDEAHPDLHVFTPDGLSILVDDAEEIIKAASRTPVEGRRKVLVLTEFEKVDRAGPALLKSIEEPSDSTIFVILAEEIPHELAPIASRAVRVEVGAVPLDAMVDALVESGATPETAAAAASASAGDLRRARLLVADESLDVRRDEWATIPLRIDGTGATAAHLVDEVIAHIDAAQAPLDDQQKAEMDEAVQLVEDLGRPKGELKDLETRHKRQVRRHRRIELRFGLAMMAATYRDRLAGAPDPEPLLASLGELHDAAEAIDRNPNELLLLQALVSGLHPL
ncbi:MAG: hypothetical protein U5K30_16005 [Acidimicrobiales bacterium]|nr:hypothetical protein [Acidimicrobiales bacterium]